jgi:hypothetical protein
MGITAVVAGTRARHALVAVDSTGLPHVDVGRREVIETQRARALDRIEGLFVLAPAHVPDETRIVEDDALSTAAYGGRRARHVEDPKDGRKRCDIEISIGLVELGHGGIGHDRAVRVVGTDTVVVDTVVRTRDVLELGEDR